MNHAGYSKAWYAASPYLNMWYRGIPIIKHPNDLFVYSEILWQTKPDLIIETGTFSGGSALFLADQLDLLVKHEGLREDARVVTVEIMSNAEFLDVIPEHERITYIYGWPSTDLRALEAVEKKVKQHDRVMVILDSDHRKENVLRELNLYSKWVTPGCYLVVEDSNEDAYTAMDAFYEKSDGYPSHALREWRPERHGFTVDERRERFLFSQNVGGYLKKAVSGVGSE